MIDDIVEMVLKEARGRSREDNVANIYAVMMDIDDKIIKILVNIRDEERRKKEDENKG
jgi:hypothetical protein